MDGERGKQEEEEKEGGVCFPRKTFNRGEWRENTYARGLNAVSQNQLFPISGIVMVRTRATLARLMQVQKVSSAAWLRLGTIIPSNLHQLK